MTNEILVVDDNLDIRLLISSILKDKGFSVREAANFDQALNEINRKVPDAAVIDVKLDKGDNDGIELLTHIKKIDLNKLISRSIKLYELSEKDINFTLSKGKFSYKIKGDEEQIYRVLINLMKNSIESIHDKRNKNVDFKGKINIDIRDDSDYIYLTIEDNGVGFNHVDKTKMVTPYFTTKKSGTGLGLAVVTKVISDHKSLIAFNSITNGARVEITIPKILWLMRF